MVQYRTNVSWDPTLVDLLFISDTAITRHASIAGLVSDATKITTGAPANTAGKFIGGAIIHNNVDGSNYENIGTTAAPNFVLMATGGGSGITQLTGDVTAGPGSGSQAATIPTKGKVFVSAVDTTINYLQNKLVAGSGISITPSGAGNETLTIAATGGSGGLSQFGYFFQQVADVAGTIAADNGKALFHTASSNNTAGFTMVPDSGDITVTNAGIYEIDWSLSAAEPGAMCVYVNGTKEDLAGATYGSGAGTQQNTGKTLLVLGAGAVVSLRTDNCAAALTLQLAGTTNTNQVVASIMIKKVN